VNYVQRAQQARELVEAIASAHRVDSVAVPGDVALAADVVRIFDECEACLGPVDILINNAGVWPKSFVHEMAESEWDRAVAVNLRGPFLTCREAVRRWLGSGRGGRIVNISSAVAFIGSTSGHAHYAAAKAGLVNFTMSLAREVARKGIRVNAVAPGMVRTDMTVEALEAREQHYLDRIPLGRIGEPEEVADTIVFLASDRASYTTGATADVSGGMLMR
jgi:3-oxoacyl-[acyl-carrier protein] reductase